MLQMKNAMIKYTFHYRLNIKNDTRILNFCVVEENLKTAVEQWEEYKESKHRITKIMKLIRVQRERRLN